MTIKQRTLTTAFSIALIFVPRVSYCETPPARNASEYSSSNDTKLPPDTPAVPVQNVSVAQVESAPQKTNWDATARQSFMFLAMQHGVRMTQIKTRRYLGGKFFDEWANSASHVGDGWSDGDSFLTNYVGHPMQEAISGYILVQNDPKAVRLEYGRDRAYWNSRFRAMAWSTFYSTQFELGPASEASIGHVGKVPGTQGVIDLVVTPVGGFSFMVAEDALDRYVVKKLESRTTSAAKRRFYRILFNPDRAVANCLRFRVPWHRDSRSLMN